MKDRHGPSVTVGPVAVNSWAVPWCKRVHRRLPDVCGGRFAIAAYIDNAPVGVALVAHPQARMTQRKYPHDLEVVRVAVIEGAKNACSALYGASSRAARAMGATDLFTYVHKDETGHSLKAAGWVRIGLSGGGDWDREARPRQIAIDSEEKIMWSVAWGRRAKSVAH